MEPKTIVITGASDGIGAAAARTLAAHGHEVVLVGRSPAKTAAIAGELDAEHHVADFAHLRQVRALADDLLERHPRIDVLANNAGLMAGARRRLTGDGHELTFQVNYLAGFLLTALLRGRLLTSRATVINTSSLAHQGARLRLDDLEPSRGYNPMAAYGASKLAQVLHVRELHRRYAGEGLSAAAFHPGVIASNFAVGENRLVSWAYRSPVAKAVLDSPDTGADTLVFLAEGTPGTDFASGGYFVKRKPARTNPAAADPSLATGLWKASEQLLGVTR